jgi:hypothetical protein
LRISLADDDLLPDAEEDDDRPPHLSDGGGRRGFLASFAATIVAGAGIVTLSGPLQVTAEDTSMPGMPPRNRKIGGLVSKIRGITHVMVCDKNLIELWKFCCRTLH